MRLGIGSMTYPWAIGVPGCEPEERMDAFALLDRAAELGVQVVQFCERLPMDTLTEAVRLRLAECARSAGIALQVGLRGLATDRLHRYAHIAATLDCTILRVLPADEDGVDGPGEVIRRLRPVVADLRATGCKLAIENHERMDSGTLEAIVEDLGTDTVGVCLDVANGLAGLEGRSEVVEALAPYAINLHVKDFEVRRAWHRMGFLMEGRPAGQGRLDLPWVLARLCAAGRDPDAVVEVWCPPLPTLDETIAEEDRWAVASVGYMRQLLSTSPVSAPVSAWYSGPL